MPQQTEIDRKVSEIKQHRPTQYDSSLGMGFLKSARWVKFQLDYGYSESTTQ